ncbi:MAG: glycosyltransferase family 2 protein [Microbacteriaceae bacterium]
MTSAPLVDVVIPVHTPARPIDRAVASVLDATPAAAPAPGTVRVTVVCHGIPSAVIRERLGALADDPAVRLVEFSDGVRSPAGPFNHGLEQATGEYVSIMGSDDFLEPGAMADWVRAVEAERPDAALVRLRYQGAGILDNPLTRRGRSTQLDAVRDRLFYRTAPLGLLRRQLVVDLGLRFTERLPVGKDMAFSAQLWVDADRISYLREAGCYVIGDDADDRVTTMARPVVEAMAAPLDLVRRPWVRSGDEPVRRALVTKLLRIHVLGALRSRRTPASWSPADVAAVRDATVELLALSPRSVLPFSRAERALVDAARVAQSPEDILQALARDARPGRIARILPRNLLHALDRESVLTRYVLYRVGSHGR